jgi:hypothetical protein
VKENYKNLFKKFFFFQIISLLSSMIISPFLSTNYSLSYGEGDDFLILEELE